MSDEKKYDAAIIGGGLAGLCMAVLLADSGHSVVLFEKEKYPFNKVCGEYISMESWDFLESKIGVPLRELNPSYIKKLLVTAPDGNALTADLDLGGFGISRYLLDNTIKEIAESKGVIIHDGCKAEDISFAGDTFSVKTTAGVFEARACCGSWGKRSNIDVKWQRSFVSKQSTRLNNYIGVKYHVTGDFPQDLISLHNFKDGYCGFSQIEDGKHCLCYFTKAINLKKSGHSIDQMEQKVLAANPRLRKIFQTAEKINAVPVTISQVSLAKKTAVENHVLLLGDAAGMISPLCGNGMSIAMHSAKIAAEQITLFLAGKITRSQMEKAYATIRKNKFGRRIATGRLVQFFFGRETATNIFLKLVKRSNFLTKKLIALTHGKSF